jgi:hypothetical protein
LSIGLKWRAEVLVAALALSAMTLVALPGAAEAQEGTDGASVGAAQNANDGHAAASRPAGESPARLVVEPGDCLWSIGQKRLGPDAAPARVANEVERIFEVNRDRIGDDPGLIFAGQELFLPPVAEPVTSVPAASEPATGEPATSTPATGEPAAGAPVAGESATSEPATSAPDTSEPATSGPPGASAPDASEPVANQPAGGGASTTGPDFEQGERRLLGLGVIVLTFVLAGLMAWKLPMRRGAEEETWEMPAWYPDYYGVPPTFGDETSANGHDPEHAEEISGTPSGRRKETRRIPTPGPRRLPRRGWATGAHNPQIRRFLRRVPRTGGRRANGPPGREAER